ncbi:beta-carotene 15,15'-monooxygenase [Bifidobacteriaceae bacterium GH022]|nr:beta-carotene 15,15'-monooxygenase [Bifidobacteriaceae bacterium GH022]
MKRINTSTNAVSKIAENSLIVFTCIFLATCTSLGVIYRAQGCLTDFNWLNALIFAIAFCAYYAILRVLIYFGKNGVMPKIVRFMRAESSPELSQAELSPEKSKTKQSKSKIATTLRTAFFNAKRALKWCFYHSTRRKRNIFLTLIIGWLWAPVTLLAAYGADICSQIREYSWAWNQVTGLKQPYIGFFSFVPADIYPTAHYLWPAKPTYLSDQHNIVLTLIYGATAAVSRYFTESNDAGIVLLAVMQFVLAAFCCAATANRFLNTPWASAKTGESQAGHAPCATASIQATPIALRAAVIITFLFSPLVVFSTISLTKSPLFAFAFVWWFGIMYELNCLEFKQKPAAHTIVELIISVCIMLIAAKYAWYILAIQFVLMIISSRKRWKIWVLCILLPTILIHGAIMLAISSGAIINGDPIESRGVQLQQIARIAKLDPKSIPHAAKRAISPIFNLSQTAEAYTPQDADPVKSSGLQSKKVSYRWRYITKDNMKKFNHAWLLMITHSPIVATDALLAKSYGYFDILDVPYVGPEYYVNTENIKNSEWIRYWLPEWRGTVSSSAEAWSNTPILGWIIHGNLYVVATLLIGVAEIALRRWKTLVLHAPLALLMGVMVLAPANNFERHMLPIAFVFFFTVLMFVRDSVCISCRNTCDNTCRQSDKINCDLVHDSTREDSHNNTREDSHKN